MGKLEELGIKYFGPNVLIKIMENEKPEEIGKELANLLDGRLDAQFGDKRSEKVQDVMSPWIMRFAAAFCKALIKD